MSPFKAYSKWKRIVFSFCINVIVDDSVGMGVECADIVFHHQVIYFKSLEGDSGEGTPICGGEPDAPLSSPYYNPNNGENAGLFVKPRLSASDP